MTELHNFVGNSTVGRHGKQPSGPKQDSGSISPFNSIITYFYIIVTFIVTSLSRHCYILEITLLHHYYIIITCYYGNICCNITSYYFYITYYYLCYYVIVTYYHGSIITYYYHNNEFIITYYYY